MSKITQNPGLRPRGTTSEVETSAPKAKERSSAKPEVAIEAAHAPKTPAGHTLGKAFDRPVSEGPSLRRPTAEVLQNKDASAKDLPQSAMRSAIAAYHALPRKAVGGYGSSMSFEELSTFVLNAQVAAQGLGKLCKAMDTDAPLNPVDIEQLKGLAKDLKEYSDGFGPKIAKGVLGDASALLQRIEEYSRRTSSFSSLCNGVWMCDTTNYFLTTIEQVPSQSQESSLVRIECSLGDRKHATKPMPGVQVEETPEEVDATIDALLEQTKHHLDALGVKYEVEEAGDTLRILPDKQTSLGRFADGLSENLDSTVIFAPKLLWARRSRGAFHSEKKILFLSAEAIEKGEVTTVELHEARHAFFEKDAENQNRRELFRGRVKRTSEQTSLTFDFQDPKLAALAQKGSEWIGRKAQKQIFQALEGKVKARVLTLEHCCKQQIDIYAKLDRAAGALSEALNASDVVKEDVLALTKEIQKDLKALHQTTQIAQDITLPDDSLPDLSQLKTRWGKFFNLS
ncbi:MAG: hypothetical protein QGI45_14970 [Myxococcota bacterium]|jgi:hypothetical protein|nr:hypothetical protein [Myxococcota bacterium]